MQTTQRRILASLLALTALALLGRGAWWYAHRHDPPTLQEMVEARLRPDPATAVPCPPVDAHPKPLHLLVLGQSNAANSGQASPPDQRAWVTVWADGRCHRVQDPLPGGTAQGGSIWSRLPAELARRGVQRPVVITVVAVGNTSLQDWVGEGSPLGDALQKTLRGLTAQQRQPEWALWQQGEADGQSGSTTAAYSAGLARLAAMLRSTGTQVPLLLGKSTVCRGAPAVAIHQAIDQAATQPGFGRGADTDALIGQVFRSDGCHFTAMGLDNAAGLWADAMRAALPPHPTTPPSAGHPASPLLPKPLLQLER